MKRIGSFIAIIVMCFALQSFTVDAPAFGDTVYICTTGKVYHSTRSCKGLRNAKHPVIAMSRSDAISQYGRRACKICY